MNINAIQTPHLLRLESGTQQPLVNKLDLGSMAMAGSWASNIDPTLYAGVTSDNADIICRETNLALWYPHYTTKINGEVVRPTDYPGLDYLESAQATSSYGFVMVASKLMEEAEIPHYITYINGHATILAVTGDESVRLADPLSPELNFDASGSIDTDELIKKMDASINGKHSFYFDSRKMANALGLSWNSLALDHPWISASSYHNRGRTTNHRVVATAFHPETGRQVLTNHSMFLRHISERNFVDAALVLAELGDLYPEVDLRQKHSEIKLLSRRLAEKGLVRLARISVVRYLGSISTVAQADPRADVLRGDCLRMIAVASGDLATAEEAIGAYEAAKVLATHGLVYISGKIRKAKDVAAGLIE